MSDTADAAMPPELKFFTNALGAFVRSKTPFQVVYTSLAGSSQGSPTTLTAPPQPRLPPRKLVVLDSSFNPPTIAHMQMATSAIQALQQQEKEDSDYRLLLLLSVNNADKAPKPAAFEQRLALMLAMAKDLQASLQKQRSTDTTSHGLPIDIGLTSQPYFHAKSEAIAASDFYASSSSSSSSSEQVFLIGYDTLIRLFDPKYYTVDDNNSSLAPGQTPMQAALSPFLGRARLRVTTRPDDQWGDEEKQEQWLQNVATLGGSKGQDWRARIELTPSPFRGEDIVSSTMARKAAKAKHWAKLGTFVGPSVLSWVESQKLYSE